MNELPVMDQVPERLKSFAERVQSWRVCDTGKWLTDGHVAIAVEPAEVGGWWDKECLCPKPVAPACCSLWIQGAECHDDCQNYTWEKSSEGRIPDPTRLFEPGGLVATPVRRAIEEAGLKIALVRTAEIKVWVQLKFLELVDAQNPDRYEALLAPVKKADGTNDGERKLPIVMAWKGDDMIAVIMPVRHRGKDFERVGAKAS